jgi:hypothetical protein
MGNGVSVVLFFDNLRWVVLDCDSATGARRLIGARTVEQAANG